MSFSPRANKGTSGRTSEGARAPGMCVISIDTELAWGGAHHRDGSGPSHDLQAERQVIDALLALFARYQIAATWALVGHLFLSECKPDEQGRLHPDLLQPDYDWLDGHWLDIDPGSDLASAPDWYGRDIVEKILACPTAQEIGSHAFTHVIADDPGCGPEVLASELAASQAAARGCGVSLRSFVYPRNSVAHLDVLPPAGFNCYRGSRPHLPFAGRPAWQRRLCQLLDRVHPLPGSAVLPALHDDSLVNVAQTYLFAPESRSQRLPTALSVRPAVARVRQAAREGSLFHLWFHPYNITATPERALAGLQRICEVIDRERDRGRVEMLTMSEVADRVQKRPASTLAHSH